MSYKNEQMRKSDFQTNQLTIVSNILIIKTSNEVAYSHLTLVRVELVTQVQEVTLLQGLGAGMDEWGNNWTEGRVEDWRGGWWAELRQDVHSRI